ncbi:MAG: DUF72 domain-containing protein [Candidatus Nanopelagicales bacterium]|nr:DUF72 domain-containing protein [Candidatus Nanopelagicales bacterium]
MAFWVGTSGWSYDHWDGVLYPPGTPPARRLAHYVAAFETVELNASFYRWPRPATFAGWRERLPDGFRMAVKAPRGLTHARRLRDPGVWVDRMAPGLAALGDRFAVLLVQLPPDLERDDGLLDAFLAALPPSVPVAVELRHASWQEEDVLALLAARRAAYVVMSGAHLPCVLRATAPFVYVRLHGPDAEHLYAGSYPAADLDWWAERFREWAAGGSDVYGYFNNDGAGNAVRDARELLRRLA